MRVLTLIVTLVTLSACAPAVQDSRVASYIEEFEATYGVSTRSISIEFVDQIGSGNALYAGYCKDGSIVINEAYWKANSNERREALIYHELGHCLFGRGHTRKLFSDGCFGSFMSSYDDSSSCLRKHRSELIRELHTVARGWTE